MPHLDNPDNPEDIIDLVTEEVSLVRGPANRRTNLVLKNKEGVVKNQSDDNKGSANASENVPAAEPVVESKTPTDDSANANAVQPAPTAAPVVVEPVVTPPAVVAPVVAVVPEPAPEPKVEVVPEVEAMTDSQIGADVIELSASFESIEDPESDIGKIAVAKSLTMCEKLSHHSEQIKGSKGAVRKAMYAALITASAAREHKNGVAQLVQKSIIHLGTLVTDADPESDNQKQLRIAEATIQRITKSVNTLGRIVQKSNQPISAISAQPASVTPTPEVQSNQHPAASTQVEATSNAIMNVFRAK